MKHMATKKKMSPKDKRIRIWICENRGMLKAISERIAPAVTPHFVGMVLRGQRKSRMGRVERELKRAGAPV